MSAHPDRATAATTDDPALHELSPVRFPDREVAVWLRVRRDDAGCWRASAVFTTPEHAPRETAEIFRGESEAELWESVQGLQRHHFRALYLSLA